MPAVRHFVEVLHPAGGSVDLNPNGSFTYTPDAGFVGTDTFTYVVNDARGKADTASVTITVVASPPCCFGNMPAWPAASLALAKARAPL